MSSLNDASGRSSSFSIARVLGVVVPVAMIAVIIGFAAARMTMPTSKPDVMPRLLGLSSPVQNRLADEFEDADGDLVADAPADKSKCVRHYK